MRVSLLLLVSLICTGIASAGTCVTTFHHPHVVHHVPHRVVHHDVIKVVEKEKLVFVTPFFLGAVNVGYGGVAVPSVVPPVVNAAPAGPSAFEQKALSLLEKVDSNVRQLDNNIRTLDGKVQNLDSRVSAIEQSRASTPTPQPPTNPNPNKGPDPFAKPAVKQGALNLNVGKTAEQIFTARCASCHTDGALKNTKFAMFDSGGKLLNLTDKQWRKTTTKITTKQMPPEKDDKGNPIPELPIDEYEALINYIAQLN